MLVLTGWQESDQSLLAISVEKLDEYMGNMVNQGQTIAKEESRYSINGLNTVRPEEMMQESVISRFSELTRSRAWLVNQLGPLLSI